MHLRAAKAVEAVELHRRQRRAQVRQFFGRLVEFAALVIRADDKHAHVTRVRSFNGAPV